jgi:hypothetical protein
MRQKIRQGALDAKGSFRNDQHSLPIVPHEFRCGRAPFVSVVPFVVPSFSALLRASASPRESFLRPVKLEIRDFVDQQPSPFAPPELHRASRSFAFFAPFAATPTSVLLRASASPRESFADAMKLEIRDFVDQQSPPVAPQQLRCVRPRFVPLVSFLVHSVSALLAVAPEPKNSFADPLTLDLKTTYDEKTDFCTGRCPIGRDSHFRNSLPCNNLQLCKNAPNPRRWCKTISRRSPRHAHALTPAGLPPLSRVESNNDVVNRLGLPRIGLLLTRSVGIWKMDPFGLAAFDLCETPTEAFMPDIEPERKSLRSFPPTSFSCLATKDTPTMTRSACWLVLFVTIALPAHLAFAQLTPGNPLSGLAQLKNFETMRASSTDKDLRNGNADARPIAPGGTLTLAELNGPGAIVHLWCTIAHSAPYYSRLMTLRIYWDGEEHPSVEAPIGDFFGIGHGVDKSFTSLPIRVTSEGRARNCYWPMPFRKSARITVTNESDQPCSAFYYYVDWQKHPTLSEDAAYFHAMYRQEYPCVMGQNYLLADIEGRGHYVGTIQSVYHVSPGWYGEGDDFFYIDGEKEPRLTGTGTEDYFCNAWGFQQQDGPYYGTPLWEGYETGNRGTAYRFHIPDPIVFTKSLRAEIEHKGSQAFPDGKTDGFIERDDLMSSVAIWYQIEPHKRWPALPAGKDRLPFREEVLVKGWAVVESAKHSAHPVAVQPLEGTEGIVDGKQLFFQPSDPNGWLDVEFTLDKPQTIELVTKVVRSWDYGKYRVKLDGTELGAYDLYSATVAPTTYRWRARRLEAGKHILRFECLGKSPDSKGYFLGFCDLSAIIPVYARDPSIDLRTLQKK